MSRPLKLYSTLTRSKEVFEPLDRENVRLYVCGPTVYDYAHIGNARPLIVFDVLYRLLRHRYGADHVVYARNITDVDDKINARAARDFPGLPLNDAIREVTETTKRQFHEDAAALGCLKPNEEPHATHHIVEMVAIIERLVARGLAYVAEDNVLFSPAAMDRYPGAPRYGSLARRSLDEMIAGARVDVAPYKRNPMDFVLWKPSKPNEPGWPSPCGIVPLGRPGWHIECSAMSMAKLLTPFGGGLACDDPTKNIFDIHGGGIDLVFPHHENEIAQSCCAFNTPRMANVWMHNGFLQVEGEKMSKSLENFVTIHELIGGWKGEPWSGAAIRLAMLGTHYRQPVDWTLDRLVSAKGDVQAIATYTGVQDFGGNDKYDDAWKSDVFPSPRLLEALDDDLNTPEAISQCQASISRIFDLTPAERHQLVHDVRFLGLFEERQRRLLTGTVQLSNVPGDLVHSATLMLRDYRVHQANGQIANSNQLKDWFSQNSLEIQVGDAAVKYVGRSSAEPTDEQRMTNEQLKEKRKEARDRKDWAESDRIRDLLKARGVTLKDSKNDTTLEIKT